ncbi:Phenylalanine-tRNA ligase beta subunit [Propionispora sp. 2/2-37]|uniref:phenylalanine--tRNA ligase subunit beta n=1 Tax=Propionispora sp. 2/2-37 TaxID=1677858 RepID=UPI0006BB5B55|nr:phenylalanine--tRNA ligase subunit beta [Propionispora sp. 2/2-37]CUH96196.1 Phenylalanine-tRNA ligase beta subunit [Propionispora sp. 2/2-37]
MRASIKWLKDYVDFRETPEQLADMLTMAGVPVATVEYLGKDIENIVTGKILAIEHHPNADKLSICKIDTGSEEPLTIVTGANNIKTNDMVPVALVGAKLPNGMVIKPSKLRGILSNGMLCSAEELKLDSKLLPQEAKAGIYILPPATPVGMDIRPVLGLDDTILEFELTANRADCFSILGLAREIAVLTGGSVKKPMLNLRETGKEKASALVQVRIEDRSLCSRFAVRVLQNVKVGPSPDWLKHRLQAAGMRSINNVVDVTNFVMLELGQPMHAYDYNLLSRHTLVVRKAYHQERLTTLDGVKRELTGDMLVIADAVQAVGIAGVMGGLATEVTNNTQNILLEAACFNGASIRRTSRALGLRSEASGRFERGVDTANIIRALDRAAKLLEDMGACEVCPGIVDNYPNVVLPKQVVFTAKQINDHLGTDISPKIMIDILKRLEFELDSTSEGHTITVNVPTWRGDVTRAADISEEIARIYGYDNIPSTTPQGNMVRGGQSVLQSIAEKIKNSLSGIGFSEVISFSFTHPSILDKLNIPQDDNRRRAVTILNPITDDFPLLRTTLLGGILETIVRNLSRKNENLRIYELGAVYLPEKLPLDADSLPQEPLVLCGALVGNREEAAWNHSREPVDFYDAKGTVEAILTSLGIDDYLTTPAENPSFHPGKTAIVTKQGDALAIIGEIHPGVLDAFDITRKVYVFEMNVELLAKHTRLISTYRPLPKFPGINRDIAVILPVDIPADNVYRAILGNAGQLLSDVKLFDVYTGEQVPQGMRSLAFSLYFRSVEKTLTDEEVEIPYKKIVAALETTFGAKIRN